jgi:hypothetical protein
MEFPTIFVFLETQLANTSYEISLKAVFLNFTFFVTLCILKSHKF